MGAVLRPPGLLFSGVFFFFNASIGRLFVAMFIFGLYFCYLDARCAPFFLPVVVATAFL